MPRAWYAYNGGTPVTAAGSWTKISAPLFPGSHRFECVGTQQLCSIYAFYTAAPSPANPASPLSANMQDYITLAAVLSVNCLPQIGKCYLYKHN